MSFSESNGNHRGTIGFIPAFMFVLVLSATVVLSVRNNNQKDIVLETRMSLSPDGNVYWGDASVYSFAGDMWRGFAKDRYAVLQMGSPKESTRLVVINKQGKLIDQKELPPDVRLEGFAGSTGEVYLYEFPSTILRYNIFSKSDDTSILIEFNETHIGR